MQREWGRQAVGRKTVSTGDRNDVWEMATATSAHAGNGRLLAEGPKVTHAALESGYGTPSAFTSMFRKALGITPKCVFQVDAKT